MTLPATGPITLGMVAAELGISLPLTLGDPHVRALAGVASGPIRLGQLRGKSAYTPMGGSVPNVADTAAANPASNTTKVIAVALSLTGGVAPFNYAWSKISGDGTVAAANSANTTVSMPVVRFSTPGDVSQIVVQCTVTDATGATLTRQGTVTLTLN